MRWCFHFGGTKNNLSNKIGDSKSIYLLRLIAKLISHWQNQVQFESLPTPTMLINKVCDLIVRKCWEHSRGPLKIASERQVWQQCGLLISIKIQVLVSFFSNVHRYEALFCLAQIGSLWKAKKSTWTFGKPRSSIRRTSYCLKSFHWKLFSDLTEQLDRRSRMSWAARLMALHCSFGY